MRGKKDGMRNVGTNDSGFFSVTFLVSFPCNVLAVLGGLLCPLPPQCSLASDDNAPAALAPSLDSPVFPGTLLARFSLLVKLLPLLYICR